jgi:hypothetical protein
MQFVQNGNPFHTRKYCAIEMFLCKAGYRYGSLPAMQQAGNVPYISLALFIRESLFLSL